jgi:hypothetical protein
MSDFSDESLEGELSNEEISALLVLSDFSKSDGSGSVSVGLLDSSGGGGGLSGGLGSELLSGGLSSGGFSGGLLSSGHFVEIVRLMWMRFLLLLLFYELLISYKRTEKD